MWLNRKVKLHIAHKPTTTQHDFYKQCCTHTYNTEPLKWMDIERPFSRLLFSKCSSLSKLTMFSYFLPIFIQGFLYPCTQHPKLFDAERIETVFSNVEDIYHFQKHFLAELESRVVTDKMEDSQIGEIFVQSVSLKTGVRESWIDCIYRICIALTICWKQLL